MLNKEQVSILFYIDDAMQKFEKQNGYPPNLLTISENIYKKMFGYIYKNGVLITEPNNVLGMDVVTVKKDNIISVGEIVEIDYEKIAAEWERMDAIFSKK